MSFLQMPSATASRFPVNRPKTRDSTTIPVQIQVIAIVIPPVFVTDTQLPHKKYREDN